MRETIASSFAPFGLIGLAACGAQAVPQPEAVIEGPDVEAAPPSSPLEFKDLVGDAAAGARVFRKCQTCHALENGANRVGPHLYYVVGRTAGTAAGYNYSTANAQSGITWTPDALFDYLESPRDYLKGTRMAFVGIRDPQQRADVIAFLEANGEV